MSKVVTEDTLFSLLRDIEARLKRLEDAAFLSGQTTSEHATTLDDLTAQVQELLDATG